MKTTSRVEGFRIGFFFLLQGCMVITSCLHDPSQDKSPTSPEVEPSALISSDVLVQPADVVYIGSFALPSQTYGTSRFGYGGQGITPYKDPATGKQTLFIGGHMQNPGQVAQVQVPDTFSKSSSYSSLPLAKFLQPFASVADGSVQTKACVTTSNGTFVYGMLVYKGFLISAAGEYYGCTQKFSHGYSTLNLANTNDFKGFYFVNAYANPRTVGGPMVNVPSDWQSALGGTVLSGNWAIPIVSCSSGGPSLTAMNPDQVNTGSLSGLTELDYPISSTADHALCEGATCSKPAPEATTNDLYNLATHYGGAAFPSGTRSVLLFGRQGTGTYCYGTALACNDPAEPDNKGPHAYPYRFQIWAYDANDLLAVKNGAKAMYAPRPYAYWAVNDLNLYVPVGHANIVGAGYDDATRRWYITTDYGESPRVDVFHIK